MLRAGDWQDLQSLITDRFGEADHSLLIRERDSRVEIFGRTRSSPRRHGHPSDDGVADTFPIEVVDECAKNLFELHRPRVALAGLMH